MRDIALARLNEEDSFAAVEYLAQQPDPAAAVSVFAELVRYLYWQQKDIHRVIVMAQAGIQFGLTTALAQDAYDGNLAAKLRSSAKGLAYDLGSFTWPGWDEPGIILTEEHRRFGREAARVNLRLAHTLKKGDLPLSRACWLLGAHALAAGEMEMAQTHFAEAIRHAQTAGAGEETLLCEGYACLTSLLTTSEAAKLSDFRAIQERLTSTKEGAGFATQLQTAWKVFAPHAAESDQSEVH